MSSPLLKGLLGTAAVGGVSTGGFLAYKSFQPQNVKDVLVSKGLTVVNADSVGSWKVIAMSNKDNDAFFTFLGIGKSDDRKISGAKLKEKCGSVLSTSVKDEKYEDLLSKAKLWCLQPTPKNLEERLLIDEFETALSENEFKSVYKMLEQDSTFKSEIEATKGSETEDGKKVKAWCVEEFKKPANSPQDKAKARCTTPAKNIGEVLKNSGLSLIASSEGWTNKYKSLRGGTADTDLSNDISPSGDPAISTDEAGGTALNTWCNTEVGKEIHSLSGNYNDHLNKVKKRCV
ncbi:hypothetical protein HF1_09400 [Mycoplasma haemofelis str. Langford 1]|uniref:Uncharacterized protein n=1 Tax=Mycoplasma haemofelis (strain Langford 1) TaxID=941640 RepID=E8ZIH7_MYCHL|nr:hypothetical protein [Mycoplasma haemofelis]CBY92948.1 hypothetical protein HF1_09400 [Mycoplasma haemofelis str. Langford 1]